MTKKIILSFFDNFRLLFCVIAIYKDLVCSFLEQKRELIFQNPKPLKKIIIIFLCDYIYSLNAVQLYVSQYFQGLLSSWGKLFHLFWKRKKIHCICDEIRSEQFEQIITFTRHEYGRVRVFRNKMRSLVQKLKPLEKCQFSNCFYLIASHWNISSCHRIGD